MMYVIRPIAYEEIEKMANLVLRVFNEFVRRDCTAAGFKFMKNYLRKINVERRLQYFECQINVVCKAEEMVGMIEIKNNRLTLFFINKEYHNKGIGRALLEYAISRIVKVAPVLNFIEVNSSLSAVPIYKKLGFQEIGKARAIKGIKSVPMVLKINAGDYVDKGDKVICEKI